MRRGRVFNFLQTRFRGKRFAEVDRLLRAIVAAKGSATVLDAGGRAQYWEMLDADLRDKVSIVCLNFSDELDLYDTEASTLQVENAVGDACNMPQYGDGSFDLVHSNSVIEHVGSLQNMGKFASEVRRVGKAYYVQTPNFWFPIEPHYGVPLLHWLPSAARMRVFTSMSVGFAKKCDFDGALVRIDHTQMVSVFMMRNFFSDGTLIRERFALLTKSITMMRSYPA
ncbi:MAG: class I SAM-dependent methyltransferase [Pseudomonadota bacterium]